jgi:hypothetical protein
MFGQVWSSLFETLWITSKWGEETNEVSKRYKIRVRLGIMTFKKNSNLWM